ncbi:preprotein translocase subunit SecY [Blattabacterium cuenoti]|uniref:Protein translocase subunit SecY n=1 Tax=Blattabacterium cuenoti STAT TaxID=1457030 RepID=A0A224AJI2_9FLAO|nr:preprotein translocase subunit SecY [Blattabacterium cuenoti]BBA17301.1 preprotein translocase subunit SecY [Blattabacterium cuenoti STAT]
MNNFIIAFFNIWNVKELRKKIGITLILLLVYRFGAYVPIPGINPLGISDFVEKFHSSSKGLMQILSSFTGGAFNRASVFALGIMPYISASIIIQLMCIIIPYLQKLQRDGESGRKQISFITRWITVLICFIQAPVYLISLTQQFIPFHSSKATYLIDLNTFYGKSLFWTIGIIILTSGTLFTMWLGDKITDKGIGNGISLIIMSGIIARFPDAIRKEVFNRLEIGNGGLIILFFEFLLWLLVILFSVIIIQAIRKIPVQYVSHYKYSGSLDLNHSHLIHKKHQYIPLKMTSAGVMPIIFSQAIMLFPLTFSNYIKNMKIRNFFYLFQDIYGLWYNLTIFILVIVFTFFYTAIAIPVNQMANDLKRNGGHIPRIKPGKETSEYIDHVLSIITLPGAILLAIIAIFPSIVFRIGFTQNFALFYGGTSLLIVVGVILDISQQVNIYLLNYHYDGLMMMKYRSSR